MVETTCGVCLSDKDYGGGFASRAAQLAGIQEFHPAHDPGSRGDFLQALQQLGAEPKVCRLQYNLNTRRMMRVHVSCSRNHWTEIFGELKCIEEIPVPTSKHVLYRWKHFCSDGSVTCVGHLFERSPGLHWVVVMRLLVL
jgi:hypothetical protein